MRHVVARGVSGVRVVCTALFVVLAAQQQVLAAASPVPFSYFTSLKRGQLQQVQGKLTFIGAQDFVYRTAAFAPSGQPVTMATFHEFQATDAYGNDDIHPNLCAVSLGELEAMISGVATVPTLTNAARDPKAYVSFALVRDEGAGVVKFYEKLVAEENGRLLLAMLRRPLAANLGARQALNRFACETDFVAPPLPRKLIVGSEVQLRLLALREDRASHEFQGKIEVKNLTSRTLAPPLNVVFVIRSESITLLSPSGFTCLVEPGTRPYVDLPIGTGLAPGGSAQAVVRFQNFDHETLETYWGMWRDTTEHDKLTPIVLCGPGER